MTTHQPADTIPDSVKFIPRWVWHCTDTSIVAGQISVLSVLETFFALCSYVWLAFHFEHQWWVLISAVVAPIILLRSPESIALGVKLLASYWSQVPEPRNPLNYPWGVDISFAQRVAETAIILSAVGLLFWSCVQTLSSWNQEWSVFWEAVLVGSYITVTGIAILGPVEGVAVFMAVGIFAFGGVLGSAHGGDLNAMLAPALIALIVVWILATWLRIAFLPFSVLGIWFRSLLIRVFATLFHPIVGLRHLPSNWRETFLVVDTFHLPELLPGAAMVSDSLTVGGLLKGMRSGTRENWWVSAVMVICWYLSAVWWRWNLKATFWLWWPFVLLLHSPLEGKSVDEARDITALQVFGWRNKIQVLLVIVVPLWLLSNYFSIDQMKSWAELAGDWVSKLLNKLLEFPPPPMGLRQVALWFCCGATFVVLFLSGRLKIYHKKALEHEDAIGNFDENRRVLFLKRAHRLERWHTTQTVSFILLGYTYSLYVAYLLYQAETLQFIPAWLVGWL